MNKTILLLARFCKEIGLFDFVASPGSRSAPILLALSRIGGIEIEMVMDERSAGYVALGKSLALKKPVGLFCTSGTAALNLGPAIAEAFYQNVPLFVLTADRPAELIDQHEGQAIRQNGLFELHTVFSATLPSTESSEQSEAHCIRILQQAWQFSTALRPGPVHLNVPLREPLYPNHPLDFESVPFRVLEVKEEKSKPLLDRYVLSPLLEKWTQSPSRLVICGQMPPDWDLRNALKALSEYGDVPIVGDLAHNQFAFPGLIHHADLFPDTAWEAPELVPDILLTIGNGLVSKQIKRFIQRAKFREHWHIQAEGQVANPFGTISHIIRADPEWMLTKLGEGVFFQNQKEKNKCYLKWMEWEEKTKLASQEFHFHSAWGDGKAVFTLFQNLPEKAILFPGNSMPIR
jgi:2-succinyl-5-enolpyruvyl-6-hydroxy-3-cyclohexene-1-carboxylate synthase